MTVEKNDFILTLSLFGILLSLLVQVSYAQNIKSGNFSAVIIIDEAGGLSNSSSFKMALSAGSTLGLSNSTTYRACLGYMCVEFGPRGEILSVRFLLEFNISGASGDQGFVGNNGTGLYSPKDIAQLFVCVQDPTLTDNPVFGIVSAGSSRYIRLDQGASYVLNVAEDQPGNKFLIPVTSKGCDTIRSRMPLQLPLTAFIPIPEFLSAIELAIKYPINIIGDFDKTGTFTLVLEKNESQIIGKIV